MFFIIKALQAGTVLAIFQERQVNMSSLKDKIEGLEKREIIEAMKECNWVMARAARKLGITERMIGYKIHKYGIRKEVKDGRGAVKYEGFEDSSP